MKKILSVGIIVFLLGAIFLIFTAKNPQRVKAAGASLLFSDDFNGNTLNPAWTNGLYWWGNGITGAGAGEQENYMPSQATLSNGLLNLTAINQSSGGRPLTSGMINTGGVQGVSNPGFSFLYGYAEASIKLPPGNGTWPAFWLWPADHKDQQEIDIMENLGKQINLYYATVHNWTTGASNQYTSSGTDLSSGFHTYAVDWQPGYIDFYFDNVRFAHYVDSTNFFNHPMYLILNLALGGSWAGSVDTSKIPATMQVDWVHVYNVNPYTNGVASGTPSPTSTGNPTPAPTQTANSGIVLDSFTLNPTNPAPNQSVTASATLHATTSTPLQAVTIAVRDANNNNLDFPGSTAITISPSGTIYTPQAESFAAGTYTAFVAYEINNTWTNMQPVKTFTVGGTSNCTLPHVSGDTNGDGVVNGLDYLTAINNFGNTTSAGPSAGDVDCQGIVNQTDIDIIVNAIANGATINPTPITTPTPVPTSSPVAGGSMSAPAGYSNLIFDDQFQGTSYDTTKWIPQIADQTGIWNDNGKLPMPYSAVGNDGQFNAEYGSPDMVTVNNGLTLNAQRSSQFSGYTWKAGYLTTHGKFTFTKGFVQVRAKMPESSTGAWAGIWFLEGGTEIDLHESGTLCSNPNVNHCMAMNINLGNTQQEFYDTGVDMSAGYHVYGMEYIPGKSITMYFDGKQAFKWAQSNIPSGGAFTIILTETMAQNASGWHTDASSLTPSPLSPYNISEVQVWQ